MATNAKYRIYNGSQWVEYHFTTNAGQVSTTYNADTGTGRKFVTPAITVNNNSAGTSGARVTVGSGDTANIEVDGAHITGQASAVSGTSLQYITASDSVAVALGKLDKAAKDAYNRAPDVSGLVPYTGATSGVNLGNYYITASAFYLGSGNYGLIDRTAEDGAIALITGNGDIVLDADGNVFIGSNESNNNLVATQGYVSDSYIAKSLTSAKGDIIYASSANTPAKLAIGSDGQVLKVSSGVPTWASLGGAASKGVATSISSSSTNNDLATAKAVYDAIDALPEPMIFKGSLGSGGTITSLPTAAAGNEGYTYKVITAGTYANKTAKVGDTFICAKTGTSTYEWILIPSGDEPSGTVTSVGLSLPNIFSVSNSPVTTSGTLTASLASQNANIVFAGPSSGNAAAPSFRALVAADLPTAYGDSKNPYGSKNPHYVLAGPSSGSSAGAPSFRALVASDIPALDYLKVSADGLVHIDGAQSKAGFYLYDGDNYYSIYGDRNDGIVHFDSLIQPNGVVIPENYGIIFKYGSYTEYLQVNDSISSNTTITLPPASGTLATQSWVSTNYRKVTVASSAPSSPSSGDIWIETAA